MSALTNIEIQTIITSLENTLVGGVIEVRFEGRQVRYDTIQAKLGALNYFRQRLELANLAANPDVGRVTRIVRMYGSKGL